MIVMGESKRRKAKDPNWGKLTKSQRHIISVCVNAVNTTLNIFGNDKITEFTAWVNEVQFYEPEQLNSDVWCMWQLISKNSVTEAEKMLDHTLFYGLCYVKDNLGLDPHDTNAIAIATGLFFLDCIYFHVTHDEEETPLFTSVDDEYNCVNGTLTNMRESRKSIESVLDSLMSSDRNPFYVISN
jgi:hypothetical protein